MNRKRVLIVGGGFTGLTAARALARSCPAAGITLIESSPVLGGLAAGFPLCGTSLEKSYHYLFLTDSGILALVRELGLEDRLIWADTSVGVYLQGRVHPFTTPLDLLRFSPCRFRDRVRLGVVALYLQRRRNWRPLLAHTARSWMRRACGDGAMAALWDPLLRGKFDRYADVVSMAWLWARIHTRANSRRGGREQLGYFRGGFAVVVNKLVEELTQRGVELRTGNPVETIDPAGRRARVGGAWLEYDQCLFTGPSSAFARLLPADPALEAYRRQLDAIDYLGAICLVFTSDQSVSDQYWVNINEPDAPFLVFLQHTKLIDPALYQGRHVYYIGAYLSREHRYHGLSDDELTALWWGYLRRVFPQFDSARVQERHVFRFQHAQHIVDTDYESKLPAYQTPLPGVWLANFSQIFPEDRGTNYAVREGHKLAAMISQALA